MLHSIIKLNDLLGEIEQHDIYTSYEVELLNISYWGEGNRDQIDALLGMMKDRFVELDEEAKVSCKRCIST